MLDRGTGMAVDGIVILLLSLFVDFVCGIDLVVKTKGV